MNRPAPAAPLPAGFRIVLDDGAREISDGIWFGGSPARIMRLTRAGQAAFRELRTGPVSSRAGGLLARRLTDTGFAHPRPPRPAAGGIDLTVVIPVRDRAALLDRCLSALGRGFQVVVVDDASADPLAIRQVAVRHGARLLRREVNGGPSAARNTALTAITSEFVAFVDSDCEPEPGWIFALAPHFADQLLAAVAPRITAVAPATWPGRYTAECGSLDLGPAAARVLPGTRVSYVPTAALLVRRSALLAVAIGRGVFDEGMRTGEDVDLIWRLHEAGWRIRYVPEVTVRHREPETWTGLLTRRFRYGTSAAPLARRHPGSVPPLVLHPWPALTVAALLARRPVLAAAAFGAATFTMTRTLRRSGIPARGVTEANLAAVRQTWLGTGRYATQFAAPALAAALIAPGGSTAIRRWGRRIAAGSLLLGPPLARWAAGRRGGQGRTDPDHTGRSATSQDQAGRSAIGQDQAGRSAIGQRPTGQGRLGPVRFVAGQLMDDVAYGCGVWVGCAAERTTAPVRPAFSWRPLRLDR